MKCHNWCAALSLCLFISICASNCVRVTALTVHLFWRAYACMRMLLCCACVLCMLGVALLRICSAYWSIQYTHRMILVQIRRSCLTRSSLFDVVVFTCLSSLPCVLSLLIVLYSVLCLYEVLMVC